MLPRDPKWRALALLCGLFLAAPCRSAFSGQIADTSEPFHSARPTPGDPLIGPSIAESYDLTAHVTVTCDIGTNGRTTGCSVTSRDGTFAFKRPALEFAQNAIYVPATAYGVPVVEFGHTLNVLFRPHHTGIVELNGRGAGQPGPQPRPRSLEAPLYPDTLHSAQDGAVVKLSCTVADSGDVQGCHQDALDGNAAFGEFALAWVRTVQFEPTTNAGGEAPRFTTEIHYTPPGSVTVPQLSRARLEEADQSQLSGILYPQAGQVVAACDIGVDTFTANCRLLEAPADAREGQAVLKYAARAQYEPARFEGVPVVERNHRYSVSFDGK